MRARSLIVIVAVFGSAALGSALLVGEVRRAVASGLAGSSAPADAGAPTAAAPGPQLPPPPGRALPGTGSVEGTVRDPAGRSLAGVTVRVVEHGDARAGTPVLEARTGFEGEWRIDGLGPGRAAIVARLDGVALGVSQVVRVQEGRASRAELVLPAAGVLAGHVRHGGAAPPAGTEVLATALSAGLGSAQLARATVDRSGSFSLALPAGEYRVQAAPADTAAADLRAPPAFARVDEGDTTHLELALAAAAEGAGVELLVLEPGGAPSPRAVVTLRRPDDAAVGFATTAREDGRVVLAKELGVAGRPVLVRARNGDRVAEATLVLPEAGTVPIVLTGAVREGDVRAVDGAPAR